MKNKFNLPIFSSRVMKASLEPLSRQKMIQSMLNQANAHEAGPCGNFSEMYQCICNYLGVPFREEVAWVNGYFLFFQNFVSFKF